MKIKGIILIIAFIMAVELASPISAETSIGEKIDSLFITASSLDIKYRDSVGPAREAIASLGTEGVPHLIEMLGTPHGRERAALEDIFKKIGEQAVPQLTEALLTTDSLRLSRVAKMLYFFPDTSSVDNLLKVVNNDYYSARYQAIRALGAIGDSRATSAIRGAMKDSVELVRTIAAVSAGIYKGEVVLDLDYAEDSDADADANFVLTGSGGIVEVQGTAEGEPFTQEKFDEIMELARKGVEELVALQKLTVG